MHASALDGAAVRLQRAVQSPLWLAGWLALGLLVRIALVLNQRGHFGFADERDYDSLATSLLAGEGFSLRGEPSAFRPPGQVVFLAAIYALAGHRPLLAELVQAVLLALVPFTVLALGRRITSQPFVPEVAAALAAMHPGLAYASATIYPASLTAAALAAGAATPYFVPLPVLIAFVIIPPHRCPRRDGPGVVRAASSGGLDDQECPGTRRAHAGHQRWIQPRPGANDRATFRSGNWIEPDPIDEAAARSELARDAEWAHAARRWISGHPVRWLELALGRALAVLDSVGKPRTAGLHDNPWAKMVGWAMLPWIVFGLACLWIDRRHPEACIVALAFLLMALSVAGGERPGEGMRR